jgi:uncharacterized membrane protein
MNRRKKIITLVMVLFALTICQAANKESTPRSVLFFGRLHPLILHLPIGALLLTFFLDIIGRLKGNYPRTIIINALGFSAFFSIVTVVFGYFLSLEGGYEEDTLDIHFWTGVVSSICISGLFYLSYRKSKKTDRFILPLFIISLGVISVAGHFGSILTHGDNFVTEYASALPKSRTIEVVDSLKIYDDVVSKILDNKCIQCHNNTKKKGELSLLTKGSILKGGKNGKVIVVNNSGESNLYLHPLLPILSKKHMPPKGKSQLSKDELWLLKYWIDSGTSFDDFVVTIPVNDTLKKLVKKYLVFEENDIPEASSKAVSTVLEAGFSVRKQVSGKATLSIKFVKEQLTEEVLKTLLDLKEQIVELNLSNSTLTDEMTSSLKKFKSLQVLRLDNTQITDRSLKNLEGLEELRSLNLYKTNISNAGLETLLKQIQPEQIFAWETKVTAFESKKLEALFDVKINNGILDGFVELTAIKMPTSAPEKTLFTKGLDVTLQSKLKEVEIRYTINGEEPDSLSTKYKEPIHFNKTTKLKAKAFKKGWLPSETLEKKFFKIGHKIAEYTIVEKPDIRYPGAHKLFNFEEGSMSFKDGKWTGFLGTDINTTIDLGAVKNVSNISLNCLENLGNWIVFPTKMIAYSSLNGKTGFKKLGEVVIKREGTSKSDLLKRFTIAIPNTKTRFIKIIVKNPKKLPKWHEGAGQPSWIFVDEIFLW